MYNIEVDGDHVYRILELGLLVHNASCSEKMARSLAEAEVHGPRPTGAEAAHMIPTADFIRRSERVQEAIKLAKKKFDTYIGKELRDTAINGFWAARGHLGTHRDKFFLALGRAFDRVNSRETAEAAMADI